MEKSELKELKRQKRIREDLETLGLKYPKDLKEKIEEDLDKKAKSEKFSPSSLSKKLLEISPDYKLKAHLSVFFSILGEIAIFASYFFGAFAAQAIVNIFQGKESIPVYKYAAFTFVALIIYFVFTGISSYLSHSAAFHILDNLRKAEFRKLQRISSGYLVEQPVGKIKVLLHERVQDLEDWVAHLYPEFPGKILHPLLSLLILFIPDWRIGISVFAPLPVLIFGYLIMMNKYEARLAVYMSSYAYLSQKTVEFVRGIPVIKAFLQEDKTFRKYKRAYEFYHDSTIDWYKKSWLSMAIVMAAVMTPLIATLPLAFHLFSSGQLEVWGLLLSIVLPLSILPQAFILAQSMELFQVCTESVHEIFELLDMKEQSRPEELKASFDRSRGIEFKNVSFSYDNSTYVLHDISFEAEPDEITALVGASGSGKSTIAKLIAGYWDQNKGDILIEGVENKNIPYDKLMGEIAYVSQDNFLFNTTVKENLLIAKPDASEEELISACKLASCHDFIMNLPQGYDTIVGEGGGKLSGGERQRITIARAMLKDARIIVLDEATAYTDPENEAIIQKALSRLVKEKTLIVVAHRLHTIENADKIIVLDKGRIESQGRHDELLKSSDVYKRLWTNYTGGEVNV